MFTYSVTSDYGVVIFHGFSLFKKNAFHLCNQAAKEYLKGLGLTSSPRSCTINIRYEAGNGYTEWTREM